MKADLTEKGLRERVPWGGGVVKPAGSSLARLLSLLLSRVRWWPHSSFANVPMLPGEGVLSSEQLPWGFPEPSLTRGGPGCVGACRHPLNGAAPPARLCILPRASASAASSQGCPPRLARPPGARGPSASCPCSHGRSPPHGCHCGGGRGLWRNVICQQGFVTSRWNRMLNVAVRTKASKSMCPPR